MKFQIYGIGDNGVKVKLLSFKIDVGDKSADSCAYILRSQIRQHLIKRLTPQPEIVRKLHGITCKEKRKEYADARQDAYSRQG